MANNYSITFMSLRDGTSYTVHIGGGTGPEIPLKGGAQPFTTQEDDDEDMFVPVRTQSGYFRIVNDGRDANGNAFDWHDLIPATDTSRPVTLTHASGFYNSVEWVGFMQAQDFGSVLYGNPQEREFPIQCVITITEGTDINYQQTAIQNFAYLLMKIVESIPNDQRPIEFYIQGGADARSWLLKKIDWQNFVSEDADGNLTARFNCFECLQDMCSFWGWTARTHGTKMYLTCADDSAETTWLYMPYQALQDLAAYTSGTMPGDTSDTFQTADLDSIGDIFASVSNDEYLQRGYSKAVVTGNSIDLDSVIEIPESFADTMKSLSRYQETYDGVTILYSNDTLTMNQPYTTGTAISGKGSFNVMQTREVVSNQMKESDPSVVIRLKKTYTSDSSTLVSLETVYEHIFAKGNFTVYGVAYQKGKQHKSEYTSAEQRAGFKYGKQTVRVSFGIGSSRSSAMWYNGSTWSSTKTTIKLDIGGSDGKMRVYTETVVGTSTAKDWKDINISQLNPLKGKVFIDFYGSEDMPEVSGERAFELQDFSIAFTNNMPNSVWNKINERTGRGGRTGYYGGAKVEYKSERQYSSSNNNSVRNEYNVDAVYASDNYLNFGLGMIANEDGSLMETVTYGSLSEHPEQHLADRVTSYWRRSRRRLAVDLRADVAINVSSKIGSISPRYKVNVGGMTTYPISISREWRDDVLKLTVLEL